MILKDLLSQKDVIYELQPTGLTLKTQILPQYLKPLGYSTHAVGKYVSLCFEILYDRDLNLLLRWHLGFCKWAYTPTERGFDTFRGFYTANEDYFSHTRNLFMKKNVTGL